MTKTVFQKYTAVVTVHYITDWNSLDNELLNCVLSLKLNINFWKRQSILFPLWRHENEQWKNILRIQISTRFLIAGQFYWTRKGYRRKWSIWRPDTEYFCMVHNFCSYEKSGFEAFENGAENRTTYLSAWFTFRLSSMRKIFLEATWKIELLDFYPKIILALWEVIVHATASNTHEKRTKMLQCLETQLLIVSG